MKRARRTTAGLALFAALFGGCSEDAIDLENSLQTEEVIGGTVTMENPHVGTISGCTATLVAPNVIITAAHCVDYRSGAYGDNFTIRRADGSVNRYRLVEIISYSRGQLGPNDITLGRLDRNVPPEVASPAPIASSDPAPGETLTIYGYGCTARGRGTDWQKRKFSFPMGTTSRNLCPGDSGGPVMTASGAVLRINSGYYTNSGTDIFGHVPTNFARVSDQITRWSGMPLTPPAPPPPPPPVDGDAGAPPPPAPPPPPPPAGDSCGIYAPFPEYTCRRTRSGFARCRPGGMPEFLNCPSGYYCNPGSQRVLCYPGS